MGVAFRPEIVRKALEINGQIDPTNGVLLNLEALVGTYHGSITEDILYIMQLNWYQPIIKRHL